ncbi:MAG: hypothetical protein P8X42_01815 [Calditrichaceae bacterium]|jgi:hypothetical protein
MKKNLMLLLSAAMMLGLIVACGGGGKKAVNPAKDMIAYEDPFQDLQDMSLAIIDAGGIAAVGQSESARQDLAKKKSVTDAQGQLAEIFNTQVNRMKKMFQEEIGSAEDSEINEAFTTVTKVLTSTMLQGAITKKTKYLKDPQSGKFTAASLVAIEPDKVNMSILDEVKKSKPKLYERFRASQAYEELDQAMEKYKEEQQQGY